MVNLKFPNVHEYSKEINQILNVCKYKTYIQ